MTNAAENILLRNILLDAASREFEEELSDREPVAISSRFRLQMQNMMANPARWAKRRRRPIWKQAMQTAAAVLIVCSLTIGSIMVASPTARAAIIEWVTEWYENSIIYRFFGAPTFEDMPQYKIAELPVGYRDTETPLDLPNNIEITYENESGDTIRFEYMRAEEGSAIVIDTANMEISEIEINGCPGYLYVAMDHEQSNCITWYDVRSGIQFVIDGFYGSDELVRMAESVLIQK